LARFAKVFGEFDVPALETLLRPVSYLWQQFPVNNWYNPKVKTIN
jgi:hypothetical protein